MKRVILTCLFWAIAAMAGAQTYINTGGGHWISKNMDGEILVLEDGSLWQVYGPHQINSMLWLMTESITVLWVDGTDYYLINTDAGDKVGCKYLGRK